MGKFADNVSHTAKLVASTLPKVEILGVVCHVPVTNFEDALAFSKSIAKASEYLDVNAKTDLSGGMLYTIAAQILIGESLIDEAGNPVLSDRNDRDEFLKAIYKDEVLKRKLEDFSGWTARVDGLKSAPKTALQPVTDDQIQEVHLGNSELPLHPE